jgi:hypothetical protein
MTAPTCSEVSLSSGEPLAGSATFATRWLLLEAPGRWGRDVADTELPPDARAAADAFAGRVQLIRRHDRRGVQHAAFVAETGADGGVVHGLTTPGDLGSGERLEGQVILVCCHGRRDPCCARAGQSVYDALQELLPAERLWQSSHLGGHRLAANVLALPSGILLGRVTAQGAAAVVQELVAGRIPLDHYRGRVQHSAAEQAADAAVRVRLGLREADAVTVSERERGQVRVTTPQLDVDVTVEEIYGAPAPASCGAAPEPLPRYVATILA